MKSKGKIEAASSNGNRRGPGNKAKNLEKRISKCKRRRDVKTSVFFQDAPQGKWQHQEEQASRDRVHVDVRGLTLAE